MEGKARAFADGIRIEWAQGINNVAALNYSGVEDWLSRSNYAWVSSVGNVHKLDISGCKSEFSNALASEISRFGCATYESMLDAAPPDHAARSIGWMLVRHYYAIFYAAHALLRISGKAVVFLADATCKRLSAVAGQYLGVPPKISKGTYLVSIDKVNRNNIDLECISAGNGGSHAEMWKQFLQLLVGIENSIVLNYGGSISGQNAVALMRKLRLQLCSKGRSDGSWPSMVRNALNYKHDHGVWFPYKRAKKDFETIVSRLERWQPRSGFEVDIESTSDELEQFADCCNVMAYFLGVALIDLSNRSVAQNKSFVDDSVLKLLRQRQIGF